MREQARDLHATDILQLCDRLRDDVLPNLGVRLEDRENGASAVKLVDREQLLRERDAKRAAEAERLAEKERKRAAAAAVLVAKEAQRRIDPVQMFRHETDKYSAFDESGLPTLDASGAEVSKGQLKKLQKLQQAQEKRYSEYVASIA